MLASVGFSVFVLNCNWIYGGGGGGHRLFSTHNNLCGKSDCLLWTGNKKYTNPTLLLIIIYSVGSYSKKIELLTSYSKKVIHF